MKKQIIALLLLLAQLLFVTAVLAGCRQDTPETPTTTPTTEPVSRFSFAEKDITLYAGDSTATAVTGLAAGEKVISYTASDTAVVTVSADGTVTALSVGKAIVKATTDKGNQSLMRVEVLSGDELPLPVLRLDTAKLTLQLSDVYPLTATALYRGGAAEAEIAWNSSDANIATAEGGIIRAVGIGQCTVTASCTIDGQKAAASVLVTVRQGGVSVTANYENRDFYVGDSLDLELYVYDNGVRVQPEALSFTMGASRTGSLETETDDAGNVVKTILHLNRKGSIPDLTATFTYGGQEYTLVRSVYVYGGNFVTVRVNGKDDHRVTATYGDRVTLALENDPGRDIKCWYVDGEKITGDTFVMPDKAVVAEAKLVNQTEGDFTDHFAASAMFSSEASYTFETGDYADRNGKTSTDCNYVRLDSQGSGNAAVTYHFDRSVQAESGAVLVIRFRIDSANAVLYLGTDSGTRWAVAQNKPGQAPYEQAVTVGVWQELTVSLTDFASAGEFLSSVSIGCTGTVYLDYITMQY